MWGDEALQKRGAKKKRVNDKTQRGETAVGAEEEAEGGGGTCEWA